MAYTAPGTNETVGTFKSGSLNIKANRQIIFSLRKWGRLNYLRFNSIRFNSIDIRRDTIGSVLWRFSWFRRLRVYGNDYSRGQIMVFRHRRRQWPRSLHSLSPWCGHQPCSLRWKHRRRGWYQQLCAPRRDRHRWRYRCQPRIFHRNRHRQRRKQKQFSDIVRKRGSWRNLNPRL